MKYLRVDLKICEGCGALWLRATESAYCRVCVARLREYPVHDPTKFHNKRCSKRKMAPVTMQEPVANPGGER